MNKKQIMVKLLGKEKGYYKIAFPNLKIPVEVDENLYRKMRHSREFQFFKGKDLEFASKKPENELAK
ncbi:hypothetical protein SAMN04487911_14016 [Arenibacter nanhaiticus]|uniref:Uncharacterized protein n=1 Tax=Arenibacter nanhaiticus TaxID=558155 RepID=A0A1M6MD39_9FLAO|nr:hypothetical protein [Arenibacter nanhaiticus]SHJ81329.1 hypothetical protein SAMN04487911_14016 [Arenibacter nanhaiticus]